MKRLTEYTIPETGFSVVSEEKYKRIMMEEKPSLEKVYNRLKKIEDILGDEYDLERMRLLLENDKSCYTCKNYKGEKICGFKGLDVEINPQEGCSVRKAALRREQDG